MLIVFFFMSFAMAQVRVQVDAGPVDFQQSKTETKSKQVIIGPKGKRTVEYNGQNETNHLPGSVTRDESSEARVDGVEDPGIRVERRVYYPGPGGTLQGVSVPTDGNPVITGGPGTVTTKSNSKTKTTPRLRVLVR